jgi:hypothetical protein
MIVVGTNSWVTIAEADAYLENKANAENWFLLPANPASSGEASKESFLVEAYYRILYNPEFNGLTASLTNQDVKNAQIEFAFWLLNNYDDYLEREAKIASGIESFTFSKWKEKLGDQIQTPWLVTAIIDKAGFSGSNFLVNITVE